MENNFKINKYTLLFQNRKQESHFFISYTKNTKKQLRKSILIGILIYSGFAIIDYLAFPEKIGIIAPNRLIIGGIALLFLGLTYLNNYSKYYCFIINGLFLIVGFGIVHLTYIEQVYMNSVYSVLIFFSLIPYIRFLASIVINFIIILGIIIVLVIQFQANIMQAVLQIFLLISVGIVNLLILYIKQSSERKQFIQSKRLEIKNEEIKTKAAQQDILNQKLFAQSIEIDQKNIEIEEHEHKIKEQFKELETAEHELRQNNEELQTFLDDLKYRKKELEKTNNTLSSTNLKLDSANKEILAGINYASTIQKSMLTSDNLINSYLSEYFLIYKPKDIVSGDFYYLNKIDNQLIIAVADCTGHGVSGAFITMLGITYLHDTITRKETYSTNTVLEIVRERFKRTFASFGSESQNGMDIALCALNLDTLVLQYSGANLALWIVRNGNLIENKPTHCPIGFYPVDIDFQQNEIQMEKNDIVYLFSDGILDQLSEINFKKYKRKNFRTLILENSKLSMENQKQKIIEVFENWKGKNEQTDDIVVLGFKI